MIFGLSLKLRQTGLKWLFWISCAGVTLLALMPANKLPGTLFNFWDKAQHTLAFAVLCTIGLSAYRKFPLRIVLHLAVLGGGIEIAQWASGWRQGDGLDWLADLVGVLSWYSIVRLRGAAASAT